MGLKINIKDDPMRTLPALEKVKHLDLFGIVVLLGAVSCLFLALQWGGITYNWKSSRIIGLLVGSRALSVVFGLLQYWLGEHATIPLRILRYRTVLYGALSLFFISMSSNIVSSHFRHGEKLVWADFQPRNCIISRSTSKRCRVVRHSSAVLTSSLLLSHKLSQQSWLVDSLQDLDITYPFLTHDIRLC